MTPRLRVHGLSEIVGLGGVVVLLAGAPSRLAAQVITEQSTQERVLLSREDVDAAISGARFHLGPLRLIPEVSIPEATYDSNLFDKNGNAVGDFRATISAGMGLILPVTHDVIVRGAFFPAYTYYAKLNERRFFGGSGNASFLIFANRLTLGGRAGVSKSEGIFSSEVQERVVTAIDAADLSAELRVLARLFLYGEGQIQRYRYSGPGASAASFDPNSTNRTTRLVRGGLGYRWSERVSISVGYEASRGEYESLPERYDNASKAITGTVSLSMGAFAFSFSGGYRDLKPLHGSTVPPFSGPTGSSNISYALSHRLDLQASAIRGLAVGVESPYYISTRYRLGLGLRVGWRLTLQGHAGLGKDEYATPFLLPGDTFGDRKDDVTTYGGGFEFLLTPRLKLTFSASDDRYNSNVPSYDRTFFRWLVSLAFGGNLLK